MASSLQIACFLAIWITLAVLVLLVEDVYVLSLQRIYPRVILNSRNLMRYSPSIVDDGSCPVLNEDENCPAGESVGRGLRLQVILVAVLCSVLGVGLVLLCSFYYYGYLKKKPVEPASRPFLATEPEADELV